MAPALVWPSVLGLVTGFGLLAAGLLAKDAELRAAGLATVLTSIGHVGAQAGAGGR